MGILILSGVLTLKGINGYAIIGILIEKEVQYGAKKKQKIPI